jgi:hypothetical protein
MINEANLAFKRQATDGAIHRTRQDRVDRRTQGAKRAREREYRTHGVAVWLEMRSDERTLCRAKPCDQCRMGNSC